MTAAASPASSVLNASTPARPIVVRKPGFEFGDDIPKWWFMNNPVVTHVANGLHLVFPEGERFFIRSVKHYLKDIEDPELLAQVQGFFAQESRHGVEHQHSFEMLKRQGFDISGFMDMYCHWLPRLEKRMPPSVRLSVTVALEHLTATLGESALSQEYLEVAHPTMQALLKWHAAEEIEHKSVAFDVLKQVNPSYLLRIFGMVLGLFGLLLFWVLGIRHLLKQETALSSEERRNYRKSARAWRHGHTRKLLGRAFIEYLKPGFHPDANDNYHLAVDYMDQVGGYELA